MESLAEVFMSALDQVIGQDWIKESFKKMLLEQRLPPVILIEGPKGVGKSFIAGKLAEEIITLSSCHPDTQTKLQQSVHPDIRHVFSEGKSALHNIQNIKQAIMDLQIIPYEASAKVLIIYDAHRMLPSSANALLKILEEPPSYAYIILVSSEPMDILPTILSRVVRFTCDSLSPKHIASFLQSKGLDTNQAMRFALLSQGSLDRAIEWLKEDKIPWRGNLVHLLMHASVSPSKDIMPLLQQMESMIYPDKKEEGEDEGNIDKVILCEELLTSIFYWYRDLHLLLIGGDESYLFFFDKKDELEKVLPNGIPALEIVQKAIEQSLQALQAHIKLRNILMNFFLCIQIPIGPSFA